MATKGLLDEKILKTQGFSFLSEFLADIVTVFPEYREKLVEHYNPFLSRNQERVQGDNQDKCDILVEFLQNISQYNKLITDKNPELFEKNIYLLKEVNFKKLWSSKISSATRDKLWNYLQTFSMLSITINSNNELKHIMGSLNSIVKGEEVGEGKTPEMKAVLENLKKLTTSLSKEDDDPEVPSIPVEESKKVEENFSNLFNGSKIGDLAKEIASDLNVDKLVKENSENPENLLKNLFQGGGGGGEDGKGFNIMSVVENISSKINQKITEGDLKEDDLMKEAQNMMSSMQGNNLFGNLFNQTASAMQTSGAGGMPDISKMADMLGSIGGGGGGNSTESAIDDIFSSSGPSANRPSLSGDRNEQARQRLQRKLQQRKDKK